MWWSHRGFLAAPLDTLLILGAVVCQIALLWRFPVTLVASDTCLWLAERKLSASFGTTDKTTWEQTQNKVKQVSPSQAIRAEIKIMGKESGTKYGGEITIQNNWDVKGSLKLYLFLQAALQLLLWAFCYLHHMRHRMSLVLFLWAWTQKPKRKIVDKTDHRSPLSTHDFFNNYFITDEVSVTDHGMYGVQNLFTANLNSIENLCQGQNLWFGIFCCRKGLGLQDFAFQSEW